MAIDDFLRGDGLYSTSWLYFDGWLRDARSSCYDEIERYVTISLPGLFSSNWDVVAWVKKSIYCEEYSSENFKDLGYCLNALLNTRVGDLYDKNHVGLLTLFSTKYCNELEISFSNYGYSDQGDYNFKMYKYPKSERDEDWYSSYKKDCISVSIKADSLYHALNCLTRVADEVVEQINKKSISRSNEGRFTATDEDRYESSEPSK